jgi:hypothetical protein
MKTEQMNSVFSTAMTEIPLLEDEESTTIVARPLLPLLDKAEADACSRLLIEDLILLE